MAKELKEVKGGMQFRSFSFERASDMTDEERVVELSFSSEAPIQQFNWELGRYLEILDHSPESVDMSRLKARAPLLLQHDHDCQIGVVEEAYIGADRKGRAKVRFGRGAKATEIFNDVKDGIRSLVSVGYNVSRLITEKVEENGLDTLRATAWSPAEISIVSVPADVSVGVGRASNDGKETHPIIIERSIMSEEKKVEKVEVIEAKRAEVKADAAVPAVPSMPEREQHLNMFQIAKAHGKIEIYEAAIQRGMDLPSFQTELLKSLATANKEQVITQVAKSGARSIGEIFTSSEQYRNAVRAGGGAHRSIQLEVPDFNAGQLRATLTTGTGVTSYDRPPGIVQLGSQPLTIAQLFSQAATSNATIRVTQEASYAQAATAVGEELVKPEASFDLVETDFPVRKIAVVGRVSDEMFADFPQVQAYVNGRLTYMVQSLEDNHLLNGTGVSPQITGILTTSGISTVSAGASPTVIDAIYKAMIKVSATGFFQPDYIVVNHADWQNIKLSKDSNGQYYAGGPFSGAYGVGSYTVAGMLWGLPVVATNAIAQGTALVGAFQLGATLYRREGLRLETTNSDNQDFQYNRIAIRVETRLALAVFRPLAFATVTGIPA